MKRVDKILIGIVSTLALLLLSVSIFAIYSNIRDITLADDTSESMLIDIVEDESTVYVTVTSTESNEDTEFDIVTYNGEIVEVEADEEEISKEELLEIEDESETETESETYVEKINTVEEGANLIVLDPGHGGSDPGKDVGAIYEKDINLSVALIVKDILEDAGYTVYMTRDSDYYMSLDDRVYYENQYYEALFVSLHCNSNTVKSISGMELYYYNSSDEASLFTSYMSSQGYLIKSLYNDFRVIKKATNPALLIEMGYMSNSSDFNNLIDTGYQSILAHDIANAIIYTINQG